MSDLSEPKFDCAPDEVEIEFSDCVPSEYIPSRYTISINGEVVGTADGYILTETHGDGYTVRGRVDSEFHRRARENYRRTHRRPIAHV